MKLILLLFLLLCAGSSFAQLRFDISKIKKTEVKSFEKKKALDTIYFETKYGQYELKYDADIKDLENKIVTKVQYVYTDYPANFDYTDLDFQRFAALYMILPAVFNKPWIQWEIVKQTKCSSVHEASSMFHGFVLTIKDGPEPNTVVALPPDVQKKLDSTNASLELTDVNSSEDIVKFLSSKEVKITDVRYPKKKETGLKLFKQKNHGAFDIVKGLFLTTGVPQGAAGPNNSPSVSSVNNYMLTPDKNLESVVGKGSFLFDMSIVEFDVQVDADSLIFKYAFASEEYPEFLQFNDVFGLFISGWGINNTEKYTTLNLATLPDGKTPISVSSINHLKNEQYFIPNAYDKDLKLFKAWQFDGFTKVMTAKVKVKRNQKYHIKFAISDYGDPYYDSAIFIDAFGTRTK